MAVFTPLSLDDANRITEAHGLGATDRITPIPAGSVNSNFFLEGSFGKRFLRIYEEQEVDGVRYEWALLEHLRAEGLPVPERVAGTEPGEVRVAGKPIAMFALVGGEETCQNGVSPARASAAGAFLAGAHAAQASFETRRAGRFDRGGIRARLAAAREKAREDGRDDLLAPIEQLTMLADALDVEEPSGLPTGVIHGDMFRDNVRFEGDAIEAVIDWESAADGAFVYDLAVILLAWCYGDTFELPLLRAMCAGYDAIRPLSDREWDALHHQCRAAALRFATTRITDFELRSGGVGERTHKDYRRFLGRLEALDAYDAASFASTIRTR